MPDHIHSSHRIVIAAPADTAFMFFTPAGEELWVDGWSPRYIRPADGTTREHMVFTTGQAEQFSIWQLATFDRARRRSCYVRTKPALRTGFVEIACDPLGDNQSEVLVTYTLTALTPEGADSLRAFEGEAFRQMTDGWGDVIASRLPQMVTATIR
jgi:hypothetical protein